MSAISNEPIPEPMQSDFKNDDGTDDVTSYTAAKNVWDSEHSSGGGRRRRKTIKKMKKMSKRKMAKWCKSKKNRRTKAGRKMCKK